MNLLEEYDSSVNKFNFINQKINDFSNKIKNYDKSNKYDNIESYFNDVKIINYTKLKSSILLNIINEKFNIDDNLDDFLNISKKFIILKNELNDIINFYLNDDIVFDQKQYNENNILKIIDIFKASFLDKDKNLIIDEIVLFMNNILNTTENFNKIIYNFIESIKILLFDCYSQNKVKNNNVFKILFQDFNLQPIHYDIEFNDLISLINPYIIKNSYKKIGTEKEGGMNDYNIEIINILKNLENLINEKILCIIINTPYKNIHYKTYNKIKIENHNFINIDTIDKTNIISLKNDSIYKNIKYNIITTDNLNNISDNFKVEQYKNCLILETFDGLKYNILSYNKSIFNRVDCNDDNKNCLNYILSNHIQQFFVNSLYNKIFEINNNMSERIKCYNKDIKHVIKKNIIPQMGIQEFYTFLNQKIINNSESAFKSLVEELSISVNSSMKYIDIKSTIKTKLLNFFKQELSNLPNDILIVIKQEIKNINLTIKKEFLYEKKSIQNIIRYNLSKPDNIFDKIFEIYSYQKYIEYLSIYK